MTAAITCPACGNKIEDSSEICERCGHRFIGMTEPLEAPEIATDVAAGTCSSGGVPSLIMIKGPQKDTVFYLEDFPVTIGRDTGCGVFLNNMTVS
ncbi:MAG: hypothetical protein LBH87_01225, partial [Coriobacteriales bacterium]|nr:hypothetical protein [Coriobacteriales bacterium]